jgi:hypothetical protein
VISRQPIAYRSYRLKIVVHKKPKLDFSELFSYGAVQVAPIDSFGRFYAVLHVCCYLFQAKQRIAVTPPAPASLTSHLVMMFTAAVQHTFGSELTL